MAATASKPRERTFRLVEYSELVRTRALLAEMIAQVDIEIDEINRTERMPSPQLLAARLRSRLDRVDRAARKHGLADAGEISLARRRIAAEIRGR